MQRKLSILKSLGFILLVLASCGGEPKPPMQPKKQPVEDYKEPLIEVNKHVAEDEALQIDNYVKRHGLNVTKTPTGLRYTIYQKGKGAGSMPKSGQKATINFTASLLNGKEVYTSRNGGPIDVIVDRDDVESGVHEGLKYMHVGDKAKFILPSHLAHGLAGDNNKIPPLTPVVYDIELISIK